MLIHNNIGASPEVRPLIMDSYPIRDFKYGNLGKHSYINGMTVYMLDGVEHANLQIGNFCSIGYNV
jgi:virginiamycin A acetyltransferase